ncbi:MAG: DUF998 domain-containing protein [Solirubrobacteraceae bacterium]
MSRVASSCTLAFVAIVLLEHVLVPRLHPADHMISEYVNAGGAAGVAATIALGCWGASFVATAALAFRAKRRTPVYAWRALAILLAVAGLGLLVAAACPTQAVRGVVPHGVTPTPAGRLHDLGGGIGQIAIFGAAAVSAFLVADRRFRAATIALIAIGIALGPTLAVLDGGARGLRQRALVAAASAWELGLIVTLSGPAPLRRGPPHR